MEKDIKELIRIVIGVTDKGFVLYAARYRIAKFTPKGCWIITNGGYKIDSIFNIQKWVSLHSRKRFAYPTIEEARFNFQKRKEWELHHKRRALNLLKERIRRVETTHKMAIDESVKILELPKGEFVQTFT